MAYTLGQAAKATGKSKTAIANAIDKGRLSAFKNDINQWQIDPAELHRVYPPESVELNAAGQQIDADRIAEIERLKATVAGLERLCQQIEGERNSLREQNSRLTGLLTDQRKPIVTQAPQKAAPAKRHWWQFGAYR